MWRRVYLALTIAITILAPVSAALAQTKGMVAGNNHSVTIFNADTDTVVTTIRLPGRTAHATGDCSISPDQSRGFVTDFTGRLHVIDLTTSSLADRRNPIPISNVGEDTAFSPDGKFVLVCDGSNVQPVSVVSIATQKEIGTFALGHDCSSVDVCSDGSVLVSSYNTGNVRRLTIDGAGALADTGDVLNIGRFEPNNVFCGRGGWSGGVIHRGVSHLTSFTIPGLQRVDTRPLGRFGLAGVVNQAGDRVFTRTTGAGTGLHAFAYDSATGALGAAPLFSTWVAGAQTYFGVDQLALHPNQAKVYVSEPYALRIYDAVSGARIGTIPLPDIAEPTGVCLAPPRLNFLTYDVKESNGEPRFDEVTVHVDDSLLGGRHAFDARRLEELGNLAVKYGDAKSNLDTHLVAYSIKDDMVPATIQNVRIENQFGDWALDIAKPRELLMRAAASLNSPVAAPANSPVDHFLCYDVTSSKGWKFPKDLQVLLFDEFTGALGRKYDVRKPERLCNPVIVTQEGQAAARGLSNPKMPLVCYDVKPISVEGPHARQYGVWISDQFGENRRVDTKKEKRLCVPSSMVE